MYQSKSILIGEIARCAEALFGGRLACSGETESGVYCDLDLPEPLNPERVERLNAALQEADFPFAFELSGFSGVYPQGDASRPMLQRINAACFETQAQLRAHGEKMRIAAEHDHRRLGAELGLFSASEEIGQGLVLLHPKGAILRYLLEQFSQGAHIMNGYQWVYTPHIGKAQLWQTSGHLDFYRDAMYSPIAIDGEAYYLKPMNCPFHIAIYNAQKRSYRELPYRMAEFGAVYRYELSGTLNGLTRVRGFTQDDAHIICTPEQIEAEVAAALRFSLYVLRAFGLDRFQPYIATKPKEKSIGSGDLWDRATEVLKKAVTAAGLDYEIDEGGGAFYGPKIDLKLFDLLGREWQCSTIQFDFNLPQRFHMRYVGSDGREHAPLMVHRALFGSIERFLALLIEQYRGDFPLWLAPVQFGIVPIRDSHVDYCRRLERQFRGRDCRAEVDDADENMRRKIKRFELAKVPYILIVGDRDREAGGFSVRSRREGDLGPMDLDALLARLQPELDLGRPRMIFEE